MLRNGITLHSAFCNNGNDPLCLQCWTRAKKNFGTSLFVFIYTLQILPARQAWPCWQVAGEVA